MSSNGLPSLDNFLICCQVMAFTTKVSFFFQFRIIVSKILYIISKIVTEVDKNAEDDYQNLNDFWRLLFLWNMASGYITHTITLRNVIHSRSVRLRISIALLAVVQVIVQRFSIKQIARDSGSLAWCGVLCTCTILPSCDCMQQSRGGGGGVASDAPGRASRGEWG